MRWSSVALLLSACLVAPWGCDAGEGGDADADADQDSDLPLVGDDFVRFVDPFIGTDDSDSPHPVPGGAGGSTYPGAVVPFGMVQLGPDTPTAEPSGYRYGDTSIYGFSVTHFNGAGCPNNQDIPFLPTVGDLSASPGTSWPSYESPFSHETEVATPGYYAVDLDAHGIRTELTATTRTGHVRFTFPPTTTARVLVHTGRSALWINVGAVEIVGPDRIEGTVDAGRFCWVPATFRIHFVMVFDRPFTDFGTWLGDVVTPGSASEEGAPTGGYVTFDTTADPTVEMKLGLSYVSRQNARENLDAENPGWDFDDVRERAAAQWNDVLGRVEVERGADDAVTSFYTALYHVFQNPNVASDVNGEYMGFDDAVHTAGSTVYQNFSGWDIMRSWMHLVAAIAPEAPDIVGSMVQDGVEGGLLPFWTHENVETHIMVGDPGTVNVANAYAMGVRGFDANAALELMLRSAEDRDFTQREHLAEWLDLHFAGNAAVSLEYAAADFALAQYALALGDAEAYERSLARSGYWRESWNADDGFIEPRVVEPDAGEQVGDWDCRPFDRASSCGFVEGNAAQYVWLVPHDLEGLFELMGGRTAAVARLDELFTELNAGTIRPYFYIGNEPEHGTPWVYNFVREPWRTQAVVRRIIDEAFDTGPGGLPGNDDLGATSAWLVWAYLGLYPVIPGTDVLAIHGPYFPSVVVHLANGNTLRIERAGASAGAPYVQGLRIDGTPSTRSWLRFDEIAGGATLELTMAADPNRAWGSAAADAPPSFPP